MILSDLLGSPVLTAEGERLGVVVDARFALDVAVLCGCIVLALGLGAATLRRRTE